MADIGGSKSKSKNSSFSTAQQSVWGQQSPYLMDLYQRGRDLASGPTPQMAGVAQQAWQQQMQPQMNPYLGQMTQFYHDQLGQMNNQTGAAAAGEGVFGGGRHGVEQHLNYMQQGNQVGQFLGNQYQADQARAMTAVSMAPQMQQMQFAPLQNYASILGGPTVLSSAESQSYGKSKSGSFGIGGMK